MKLIPQSIRGRLLASALLFGVAALVLAAFSIGDMLDRFSRRGLDNRIDAQVGLLTQTITPQGAIDRRLLAQIGPFTQHKRGWGWMIDTPGEDASSHEFRDRNLRGHRQGRDQGGPEGREHEARPYFRSRSFAYPSGTVTITAYAPRRIVERAYQGAIQPWLIALSALAAFLAAATFVQLRFGLQPLSRLKTALRQVREGGIPRVPEDQPTELREVVSELNGLLDENAAALARARGHVANLAHSLKTPLATLELRLQESGRDPGGDMAGLVSQIDSAIRHHLGRARAASPGAPGQLRVDLAAALEALVAALGHIHADRRIAVDMRVAEDVKVKCDPQDLDEMLGNLLDNAWKYAASRIEVSADASRSSVTIQIDDDGPGLPQEAIDRALVRGSRLDEAGEGHGFGLPIARELAELHGGALDLGPSPLGGLRATLTLPG